MQTHTTTQTSATAATTTSRSSQLSLDSLAARSLGELDALYRAATVSTTMHAADGPLIGRMLTGTTLAADGGRSSYLKVYAGEE